MVTFPSAPTEVWTRTEVAKLFGVGLQTVRDLSRVHRLVPKPVAHNGNAIGYDRNDLRVIARALGHPWDDERDEPLLPPT
ncbi:MAG: hypothetical protein IRY99_08405 [Isosphaeraceae bacterium]|nr:hypothetical protein [Isosphaeraceae bacterium]